ALSLNECSLAEKLRVAGITSYVIPEARHSFAGILSSATRLLKNVPIAAIHSHRYKENLLAWLLAKRLGVSEIITTIHGLLEAVSHSAHDARLTRWRAGLDFFVVKHGFSCAVAVSEELKPVLVLQRRFRAGTVGVTGTGR